jgi:hypothetical protein
MARSRRLTWSRRTTVRRRRVQDREGQHQV